MELRRAEWTRVEYSSQVATESSHENQMEAIFPDKGYGQAGREGGGSLVRNIRNGGGKIDFHINLPEAGRICTAKTGEISPRSIVKFLFSKE